MAADDIHQTTTRGHVAKVAEAVRALKAEGRWLPHLLFAHRFRMICAWLTAAGYGRERDLPSREAVRRALLRLGERHPK